MAFRVAVASSDGKQVNLHFGEAGEFLIYDLENGDYTQLEKRSIIRSLGHGQAELNSVFTLLKDCDAVIVSKIGPGAARELLKSGLRVFEAPFSIEAVLQKLSNKLPQSSI